VAGETARFAAPAGRHGDPGSCVHSNAYAPLAAIPNSCEGRFSRTRGPTAQAHSGTCSLPAELQRRRRRTRGRPGRPSGWTRECVQPGARAPGELALERHLHGGEHELGSADSSGNATRVAGSGFAGRNGLMQPRGSASAAAGARRGGRTWSARSSACASLARAHSDTTATARRSRSPAPETGGRLMAGRSGRGAVRREARLMLR